MKVRLAVFLLAAAWVLAVVVTGFSPPPSISVPILMYHTSSEAEPVENAELYVRPSDFEAQMTWLLGNGYTFCVFDDYDVLNSVSRPVMITFDDGYPENYTEIFPIIRKLGIPITIFVFNYTTLDADWMREMAASGLVFFESHGETHRDLTTLDRADLLGEFKRSALWIEGITDRTPKAVAYPYGASSAAVRRAVRGVFRFGVLGESGRHDTSRNPYAIRRRAVLRDMPMEAFRGLLL